MNIFEFAIVETQHTVKKELSSMGFVVTRAPPPMILAAAATSAIPAQDHAQSAQRKQSQFHRGHRLAGKPTLSLSQLVDGCHRLLDA